MLLYCENIKYKIHFTHVMYDIMDEAKDYIHNQLVYRYFFQFISCSYKTVKNAWDNVFELRHCCAHFQVHHLVLGYYWNKFTRCSAIPSLSETLSFSSCLFKGSSWLPSLLWLVSLHMLETAQLTMSFQSVFSRSKELPLAWTLGFLPTLQNLLYGQGPK